jgi:hypothetical protein
MPAGDVGQRSGLEREGEPIDGKDTPPMGGGITLGSAYTGKDVESV